MVEDADSVPGIEIAVEGNGINLIENGDGLKMEREGFENLEDSPLSGENGNPRKQEENILDVDTTDKRTLRIVRQQHTFAAKKTVAQGMMDVALITANANQLRYLIEYQRKSSTFWLIVFLIVNSLLLQIAVGISLIFKGRYDMKGKSKSPQAQKINNYVVVGVFLITIINVFVAAFSVTSPPPLEPIIQKNSS